jgi:hypothetical protein
VTSGGALASTAVSIPTITTLVDECYVVAAVANGTDISSNQTTSNGFANTNLAGLARICTGNTTSGNGGGIDAAGGTKDTAGATGATTVTLATASNQATITFALRPPQGVVVPPVTEGGIYVASGIKALAGATGATTATLDTAAIQARLTFALKPPAAVVNNPPVINAIPAIQGAVGTFIVAGVVASDPDGDTLVLSLIAGDTAVPTGAELVEDESSGLFNIEWTPTADQVGEWAFQVQATDGTATVTTDVSITVVAAPDDDLLALARAMAARAQTDVESAQALADLLDEREQMNAKVIHEVRTLAADLAETKAYFDAIVEQLEEEGEPT